MSNTPNCDKLAAHQEKRLAIADFLEWLLQEKNAQPMVYLEAWNNGKPGWVLCDRADPQAEPHPLHVGYYRKRNPAHESRPEGYYFLSGSHDDLIYEYLGIDTKALEDERRAILDAFREEQRILRETEEEQARLMQIYEKQVKERQAQDGGKSESPEGTD